MIPLVSILIPTYRRPLYLEQALRSALSQTYPRIEIIICDNSEDDATERVVKSHLSSPRGSAIRYIRNAANIGPIANQQRCFQLATGEYVNYLMDDDLFHPRKLELMVPYLVSDPKVGLVFSRRQIIDGSGLPVSISSDSLYSLAGSRKPVIPGRSLIKRMLTDTKNYIGEPTTGLFRKADLTEPFGSYGGRQAYNNVDVATWIALLSSKNAVMLQQPLSSFRKHPEQLTKTLLSRMGRKCDWIDATLIAQQNGIFDDPKAFAELVNRLSKTMLKQFPQWNEATNGQYAKELLLRVRRLASVCGKMKKLSAQAKDLKRLAERLEKG
ncbi:glycosyltransferase family 2 protein [Bacillus sp. 3255]|uniref:glycosyltransferase family 2 protein n=1 Tax=Bacillus sp. 3255 TaxID=2817904 RepID=UPI00285E7A8B|nr:glycosyltransferase family 2 protein [Bacillus sp. 3255]MDR6884835.1 glycosyltransferase involved in cell wall biosynthesis [Bacillus sp. 3255]